MPSTIKRLCGSQSRKKVPTHAHVLLLLPALAAALLFSCQEELVERAPVIRPVRYQEVFPRSGVRDRTFTGAAKAGVESKISFKVAGTLNELNPRVGDRIENGYLIARLDPRDYQLLVEPTPRPLWRRRGRRPSEPKRTSAVCAVGFV